MNTFFNKLLLISALIFLGLCMSGCGKRHHVRVQDSYNMSNAYIQGVIAGNQSGAYKKSRWTAQ